MALFFGTKLKEKQNQYQLSMWQVVTWVFGILESIHL